MKSKLFYLLIFFYLSLNAQMVPLNYQFKNISQSFTNSKSPLSNTITDIVTQGDSIWIGTNKGLSLSIDSGKNWKHFYNDSLFQTESISAIAVKGKTIWVGIAHSSSDGPVGSGFCFSNDGGLTWNKISQPVDTKNVDTLFYGSNKIRTLGITTTVNNIAYDISISNNAVWIATFAGMARKTSDNGKTWQKVILPPDNLNSIAPSDKLNFDLSPTSGSLGLSGNLNHRVFSVHVSDDQTIWYGTAGGINRSTDGGTSWTKLTYNNQKNPISGNFVIAISSNKKTNSIWAATINAESLLEERGVSFSTDNGNSWTKTLLGTFSHNFGFKDSIVYVPTDDGIYRSDNLGSSWFAPGIIQDASTEQKYTTKKFYAANSIGNEVFLGGNDGLISTIDSPSSFFGSNWKFFRTAEKLSSPQNTYSFPNPFAPGDEVARIRYSLPNGENKVSIRIFDFGMNLVKTLIQNVNRTSFTQDGERDDIWDGRDNSNNIVANGIYFYQITLNNNSTLWGKILVIQ